MRPSSSPSIRNILTFIVAVHLLFSSTSHAQPGQAQPPLPAPYYQNYAPPSGVHLLTPQERELLHQGHIGAVQIIGGGVAATMFGFGIGHAVQGRYSDVGWKFTLGEVTALSIMFVGAGRLSEQHSEQERPSRGGEELMIAGILSFGALRIWEILDAFVGPNGHNQRYNAVHWKAYGAPPQYGLFVTPGGAQGGATAGLTMRF